MQQLVVEVVDRSSVSLQILLHLEVLLSLDFLRHRQLDRQIKIPLVLVRLIRSLLSFKVPLAKGLFRINQQHQQISSRLPLDKEILLVLSQCLSHPPQQIRHRQILQLISSSQCNKNQTFLLAFWRLVKVLIQME